MKMGKKADRLDDNLILFPGLVTKLVEKGMTALKEKRYYDALKFFQQSIDLEAEHDQARYGLVITNIELNRLDEARLHCESMLREGIGSYYETLQVYISLLIQLGEYEDVKVLLEGVIQEEKLPPQMAETFYQLLEFSRQMTSSTMLQNPIEDEKTEASPDSTEWLDLLESGEIEQQWGAVQMMSQSNTEEMIEACRSFLKKADKDPILKSYLLQMLKDIDAEGTFEVTKFNESFHVNMNELEDVFHEQFGKEVLKHLEDNLGQNNPSLYEILEQVWWHYLFALYPKTPLPFDKKVWALALENFGQLLIDGTEGEKENSPLYDQVDMEQVGRALNDLKEVESQLISNQNDHP